MAMASPNESPKSGYPSPDEKPKWNPPSFAYNVPPCSPSFYQDRPLTPLPVFRYQPPRTPRWRLFRNNNHSATTPTPTPTTNTTTIATTSSHDQIRTCLIGAIVFFSILAVIAIPALIFYAFVGPYSPTFSVEQVNFHCPIFYKSPTRFSSLLNITMKVKNPARHVGIFYESDAATVASYSCIRLGSGRIQLFFQPPKDEILVQSSLTGLGVVLPDDLNQKLDNDNRNQRVPLSLNMISMIRFKMGSITSRALLKVHCEIVLDGSRSYRPKLISSSCDSVVGFWFPTIRN